MLPFSLEKQVLLNDPEGIGKNIFIERLANQLEKAKAKSLRIGPDGLSFRGGFFRLVSSVNLLVAVTSAVVAVEPQETVLRVRYKFGFSQLIMFSVIGSIFLGLFAYGTSMMSASKCIVGGVFTFLYFWGTNVVITDIRFRGIVRKTWRGIIANRLNFSQQHLRDQAAAKI